ncbi:phosphate/phosphite/phosphonate ABC transporter substrate-binding protein [Desulfopila sp. IMCC35006]|uniref:phosphate/phosphite/phosphonate ABC transporter substrate-binding protein n=1 Tax=Desulfopila sp. IMCC35006 TaxID=2569542 RepID=UPI0010ACBD29|nr:PhnD/SsuA/transferrin family substrate-binding protein [Desulfopila sp. IMCC35006]TKB25526.1 phosphate/phosphite/phosphonate ABC transporter substrate-binding protein [Desulfopila sp. IMCC35006]
MATRRKTLLYLGIGTKFFALAALMVTCCQIALAKAESSADQIRLGISSKAFSNVPKTDMKIATGVLASKVASKTFGTVESRIYDSPMDIERDLQANKLDVLAMTPDDFIRLRSRVSIEPALVTVAGNSHEVELVFLVRKDSGFNSVADLHGRNIALPSLDVQYGAVYHTWAEALVMKEGAASLDGFFSSVNETTSSSQTIMPVFFRKTAGCVISRHAFLVASELNPQLSRDLKVVAQIGGLVGGLIVFRKDLSEENKEKTREALLDLDQDQEGRQLLMLFHLNSLTPFRSEYMKMTEALYAEHKKRTAMVAGKE